MNKIVLKSFYSILALSSLAACELQVSLTQKTETPVVVPSPAVDEPASCGELTHGASETRTMYESASVPFGSNCMSEVQTRSCSDGVLSDYSGSFSHTSCRVAEEVVVTPPSIPDPSPIISDFKLGDRIQLTRDGNVRSEGIITAETLIGRQSAGAIGVIVEGPTRSTHETWGTTIWWKVDFESGVDGVVGEDSYKIYVAETVPTTPPIDSSPTQPPVDSTPVVPVDVGSTCQCQESSPSKVCANTQAKRVSGDVEITWNFTCNGGACLCGNFVNGEIWVAARDSQNSVVSKVSINNILPAGEANGAMVNPQSKTHQGYLPMYSSYDPALNIMTQLPYQASPDESLIKSVSKTSGCGTSAILAGCVATSDALTIVAQVPENSGKTVLRPGIHGKDKLYVSTSKIRLDRLPKLLQPSSGRDLASFRSTASGIVRRWSVPHHEISRDTRYFSGEFYRATSPSNVVDDYAAGQASQYQTDLWSLFGTESTEEKAKAVYALMQKGIDIYSGYKLGVKFGSGAGQHLGKKPAMVFFAAMYADDAILEEVRAIASNKQLEDQEYFQEDAQVRRSKTGVAIWGGKGDEGRYWNYYRAGLMKELGLGGTGDANGSTGDPYDYIDGPAGSSLGKSYQGIATGTFIAYAFNQHLMPWYKYAAGDSEILEYVDRYYKGRGVPNFDGGLWAAYDKCAAVSDADLASTGCRADRGYKLNHLMGVRRPTTSEVLSATGCIDYMIKWGPDLTDPGNCIEISANQSTYYDGRWGRIIDDVHDRNRGVVYLNSFVPSNWDALRDCSDPNHASYPCVGLGSEVK